MIFRCCLGAAALYLLSRITGRDAEILKSVIRVHQLKDLAQLLQTDGDEVSPLLIAVTGNVASETPIKCEHSGILAVFVEETAEQHFLKRNWRFSWVQDTALMQPITKQVPWHLDDGTGRVNVAGAQSAIGFTLTDGNEVFEKSETSSLVRRTLDYLQGHKMLGVRRMERVLPIGTHLTVVGEAVKDSIGDVRIQEPEGGPFYVSAIPLDQLISKLGELSRWFKYASMGLAFVGVVLISKPLIEYILVRRWQRQQQQQEYQQRVRQQLDQLGQQQRQQQQQLDQLEQQQRREQQQRQEQQQQQRREQQQLLLMRRDLDAVAAATHRTEAVCRELERQLENSSDGKVSDLCVICLDQKSDYAFVKCGHMYCCKTCSFKLLNKNCPICRTPIDQVLKIYRS